MLAIFWFTAVHKGVEGGDKKEPYVYVFYHMLNI